MKPETFYTLAPFMTAAGTFSYGAAWLEIHPLLAASIAVGCGLAYNWLDRWIDRRVS